MILAVVLLSAYLIVAFIMVRASLREQPFLGNLNELYAKLRDSVLEVSLLVSFKCPADVAAHELLISAAKCLVYPTVGMCTTVTEAMVAARYKEGFDYLEQARKLVD